MTYQLYQQLELPVRDLRVDTNTGADYAVVYDDEREYRIYNLLKCQKEALPATMYVKCVAVDNFGHVKFRQDEARLFQEHYNIGKLYGFEVKDVKMKHNTDTPYYELEDEFATHFFFFQGEQKYQIGDNCILELVGFTEKGYLKLAEVKRIGERKVEKPVMREQDNTENRLKSVWNALPTLDVEENETLELKTSIVFPPNNNGEANIDKQLNNILKEITAFMNTKGGELLIGIHDKTKKVIGIEGDYSHLNDGEDEYAGQYKKDIDGYELKIRNTIDKLCPSLANSLTKIEFPNVEGNVYCKVTVQAARRPIFLRGSELWVRQGNRLKRLFGDEITFFITERMEVSIRDMFDLEGVVASTTASLPEEKLREMLRQIINERRPSPIAPKAPSLKEIDYWIVWKDDMTWRRQRSKADGDMLQVPVYKGMSDPLVVFCYENNLVNVVKLSKFRSKVNLNVEQKNGWCAASGKPKNVFVAEPSSLLVVHSIDYNSLEYVKLHALTDFSPTITAKNAGTSILPDGVKVMAYSVIEAQHRGRLQHLIKAKAERSKDKGEPLSSPIFKDEIDYLKKL